MKSSTTSTLTLLFAFTSSVLSHFTLDYPLTRGFDEDLESQNFCGGFPNPLTPRQPWYYKNGPVEIDSHHDSATVNIYISYDVPTSAQSFLTTTQGAAIPPLRHDIAITGQGEFCFHANASAGVPGIVAEDGQFATIMVEYINNVHGHLYQCSDVVFTDDSSVGSNITCTDALTAATTATGTSAGASSTAASSTASSTRSATSGASSAAATTASSNNSVSLMVSVPMLALALVPALLAGAMSLA
ncbi:hypothetical protein PHBOTO_006112 [Pseudozyma hubeiensis]|nr:hypothetical protein PHBOTO_006112 [Pseudozyma hubeiensis]